MTRRFIDAPTEHRCAQDITLRDGSAAQCGRRKTVGEFCAQHAKMEARKEDMNMKPSARYDWIEAYLRKRSTPHAPYRVNVLDRYFVDDYIRVTDASFIPTTFGANKCKLLGLDLSSMYRTGRLSRHADGLWGMAGMGFPRWVYSYRLARGNA